MHGIIFSALKKYVRTRLGDEAWTNLRTAAGLADRVYLPIQTYPDAEIDALIDTVATLSGISPQQLLEDFGKSMIPDFLTVYRPLLQPDWRTLDLLEHVETRIHGAVRQNNQGANPPTLRVERAAADRVVIHYESERRWCALGRGLIQGIADHFGETVKISEEACQLEGAEACEIVVLLAGNGPNR
jgi:predicted hydrocarbon binding protein